MQIEMTGKEDRLSPWKYAIGGFPGSGKTLLASTAPNPLFVFFRENPRIKSIADRHVPHVKVLNDDTASVLEKMQALTIHLALAETEFETLVVDTGDELQVAMKEARRLRNGGEFGPGDWGWLGDTYRELMASLIDLPMRVIVLFHVKNSQEDDGHTFRELLLQGSSKDEAAGWFDLVGALDTFEVADEQGDVETKRVLLTHSSRLYPWLKDHSGNLSRRYELSDNFVGDVSAIEEVLNTTDVEVVERAVLGEIGEIGSGPGDATAAEVVTPEALETAKNPDVSELDKALETVSEVLDVTEGEGPSHEQSAPTTVEDPPEAPEQEVKQEVEEPVIEEASPEEPVAEPEAQVCAVCGEEAPEDVTTVSKIRFKEPLCRDHFREKLKAE